MHEAAAGLAGRGRGHAQCCFKGQKPQQIVRRGSTNSVRYRRAMTLLASAGGKLVQADEDTVRDVIHRVTLRRASTRSQDQPA